MSPEELWASKYAAQFAEEHAREEARREQAFVDLPVIVAGEPLRPMTPRDLLLLNGVESPFVCPAEPEACDVALFFWSMHTENDGPRSWRRERRKRALMRRLVVQSFDELVAAAMDYVDEMFQDAPMSSGANSSRRPLGTCFLAPLIVSIATETGWSQADIMGTPLPRLFQYKKAIRARELGHEFTDTSPSDRITNAFLCDLNARKN